MTQSFSAGSTPASTGVEATTFQAPGAAASGGGQPEDTTVVFEHNGRKFTKSDLARKLESADNFIEQLKAEGAENRKALELAAQALKEGINAAEILKQIKSGQAQPNAGQPGAEPAAAPQPVNVDEVVQRVQAANAAAAAEAQRKANWTEVTQTLTTAFGAAVDQRVAQMAAEKGMSLAQAAEMAKATPKAFLALFPDLSKKAGPSPLPERGKVNTQAFHNTGERKASGYTKATTTKELVSIYQQRLAEVSAGA